MAFFFSCRLVFAKLKLLMIAIEYKSEKRESRYVQCLQILKFRNALSRILPAFFFQSEHSHSYAFETFQSIISIPSYCTISYTAERLLFLDYYSSLKLIQVRTFSRRSGDSDTHVLSPEVQFIFT